MEPALFVDLQKIYEACRLAWLVVEQQLVDICYLQQKSCIMIPKLIVIAGCPFEVLPPGVHLASVSEVRSRFALNPARRKLFKGFLAAAGTFQAAGCSTIFLDGSFVTSKDIPGDYDAIWDCATVNLTKIDPVFVDLIDLRNGRKKQKKKYCGEFFELGTPGIFDLFQTEKFTGQPKGILKIDLTTDPYWNSGKQT